MTSLAGTWPLARLALRRDRILLPAWVIVLGGLPVSTASATAALYPTQAGRQGYIDELGGPPSSCCSTGRGRRRPSAHSSSGAWPPAC